MADFTVTFWGVRGGYPVPGAQTVEFGGNTTCVQVCAGRHLIVIDAGTGIVDLGTELISERSGDRRPTMGTLLFTHGHHDHTQGYAFFEPLHRSDFGFSVFGPRVFGEDLDKVLHRASTPAMRPVALEHMPGLRLIRNVQADDYILLAQPSTPPSVHKATDRPADLAPGAVRISVYHSSSHPQGGTLCYGIEYRGRRLVFATDTEGYEGGDRQLIEFARGADLLVHDAEYTDDEYAGPPVPRQGWGHSTWRMAVEVGQCAQVKRLGLTHHNFGHDDAFLRRLEKHVQGVFPRSFVAREGITVEL